MPVKVLIADDHGIVRQGLRMLIESQPDMEVAGEAVNGRDATTMARTLCPDVVIMDIAMPLLNGIDAAGIIMKDRPQTRVIVLSMHHTDEHVFRSIKAGATGYILKESAGNEVVHAVRTVVSGRHYFGDGVRRPYGVSLPEAIECLKSPLENLSRREREVLQLVVEGMTSAAIAEVLTLSPKSVETYRSRLMHKLGIGTIPELVKFALAHGITPAD